MKCRFKLNLILCSMAVALAGLIGFWLGKQPPTTSTDSSIRSGEYGEIRTLSDHVGSIRIRHDEQSKNTQSLLSHLLKLRDDKTALSLDDRKNVYLAIMLFGELKYAPAVEFLTSECLVSKLGFLGPNWSLHDTEILNIEERYPHLHALSLIGPPAAKPLVELYVRYWKVDRKEAAIVLATLEHFLSLGSMAGAVLSHIHERVTVATFHNIDPAEIDSLLSLKRRILAHYD